jgi:hypothetical protein
MKARSLEVLDKALGDDHRRCCGRSRALSRTRRARWIKGGVSVLAISKPSSADSTRGHISGDGPSKLFFAAGFAGAERDRIRETRRQMKTD